MAEYLNREDVGVVREKKQVVVDRELNALYKKHGTVTEDIVIEAARKDSHPLHRYFEWDDSVAAQHWRKSQALSLIMASKMVVVLQKNTGAAPNVVRADQPEVRRLVSAFRGEGFKLRKDALADDGQRAAIIEKHKSRLRGWCRETIDIQELGGLRLAILGLIDEVAA